MSKPTSLSRLVLSSLAFTAMVAVSSAASANVRTAVDGSACQWGTGAVAAGIKWNEDGSASYAHAFYYGGSIWQANQNGALLECPVIRNLPLSTIGLSDLEITFNNWMLGEASVTCTASSRRVDGSTIVSAERTLTWAALPNAGHPDGTRYVKTMDFGNALNASASKGTYHVTCSLPVYLSLYSVYASELE